MTGSTLTRWTLYPGGIGCRFLHSICFRRFIYIFKTGEGSGEGGTPKIGPLPEGRRMTGSAFSRWTLYTGGIGCRVPHSICFKRCIYIINTDNCFRYSYKQPCSLCTKRYYCQFNTLNGIPINNISDCLDVFIKSRIFVIVN